MNSTQKILMAAVLVLGGAAGEAHAQYAAGVTAIKAEKGKTVEVKGKMEDGKPMEDLSWASTAGNACFPGTQNEKFRGNHVFFSTDLPTRSILSITVVPDDPKQDLSIYAYSVGTNNFSLPPDLASCVSCEAEHRWDRPKKNKTQDHTRTVKLNAIQNPYNVVIGVSGPAGAVKGGFTLKVDLK